MQSFSQLTLTQHNFTSCKVTCIKYPSNSFLNVSQECASESTLHYTRTQMRARVYIKGFLITSDEYNVRVVLQNRAKKVPLRLHTASRPRFEAGTSENEGGVLTTQLRIHYKHSSLRLNLAKRIISGLKCDLLVVRASKPTT
jgi:hypothetical protein